MLKNTAYVSAQFMRVDLKEYVADNGKKYPYGEISLRLGLENLQITCKENLICDFDGISIGDEIDFLCELKFKNGLKVGKYISMYKPKKK